MDQANLFKRNKTIYKSLNILAPKVCGMGSPLNLHGMFSRSGSRQDFRVSSWPEFLTLFRYLRH